MSLTILSLAAGAALAAPAPGIVVTASRTPIEQVLSGSALTVIDRPTIEAVALPETLDLLRLVPGIAVSQSGPLGAQTQVRIRGAEANHTLTFVDGIEVNDPASSADFRYETLLSDGIERIEVLRGSQSALWGPEAIGGVINIITRKPHDGSDLFGYIEGGSFSSLRGAIGGGHGGRTGGVTAQASYLTARGIDVSGSSGERDGYENITLSTKGVLHPAPNGELGLVARYTEATSEFDGTDFLTSRPVDRDLETQVRNVALRGYGTATLFAGRWSHHIEGSLLDSSNKNREHRDFQNRSDGRRLKIGYQTSFMLTSGGIEHHLTGAAELEEQQFTSRDRDPAALSNQHRSRDQGSLSGEYRLTLPERFAAGISIRHDDNDAFADATTVRATAALLLPTGFNLHGSYGEGVADPTFYDLYGFLPDFFVGNPDLKPERSHGFDLGIAWDGPLTIDVTYFHTRFKDEIVSTFDPTSFLSSVDNASGASRRQGVEISFDVKPVDWLRLNGSYTYLDAKEAQVEDTPRVREVRRPKHSGALTAVADLDRLQLGLTTAYVGRRHDMDFAIFEPVTLGDYVLASVAASYRIVSAVELRARVENLLDANYEDVLGFATPGVGAFAGVRVRWGS